MGTNTKRKKKAKLRVDRVVLCSLILVAVIAAITTGISLLIRHNAKPHTENPTGATQRPTETATQNNKGYYIEIEQGDCTLGIGSTLQLTCIANPESLLSQMHFSTTNAAVLTVDEKGLVTIVGEGLAAAIVVADTYTDSIIIEVVAGDVTQPTTENPEETQPYSQEQQETSPPSIETTAEPTAEPGTTAGQNPTTSGNNQQSTTSASASPETTSAPIVLPTQSPIPTERPTEAPTEPVTEAPTLPPETETPEVNYEELIARTALECGFTTYTSGVYIYREDGNYLGQIIVSDSMVQISLKTRTSSFDTQLKKLLAAILPNTYETAYAQLLSANATKTMWLDGLRVRVIVSDSSESGHKQLMIYY